MGHSSDAMTVAPAFGCISQATGPQNAPPIQTYHDSGESTVQNWVAVKELKLSYHNGYIYIYSS